MPYLLGVDVGSGGTRTAICRRAPELAGWCPPEPVVTDSPPAVPGLFRRCGDDVPVYHDDLFITPQALVVEQARRAADTVWEREGEAPERVAVAIPTSWGPSRVGLLRAAFDDAAMSGVVLVTRARAVVERHQATGRPVTPGRPVAVCRIGRASTEVALVIPYEPGRVELLGAAETDLGGDDLTEAKPAEARTVMAAILDLLRRTARSCGTDLDALAAVLPAGGGAAFPLVDEVLAESIAAPVIREEDPRLTIARGAALSMRAPGAMPRPASAVDPAPGDPVASMLVLPTELMPITSAHPDGGSDPGEIPPRPPLQVAAPQVGRR